MIRVLIVEDSATIQMILTAILESDPEIQVVAVAANGADGLEQARRFKPDLITMDIHMPVMDGYEATRRIMEQAPAPIVIVSASTAPGEVRLAFHALQAGALAVMEKPEGPAGPNFAAQSAALIRTVKTMAGVKVVQRWPRIEPSAPLEMWPLAGSGTERQFDLVAIGASAGGPAALARILGTLPADMPVPIVVVQHISPGYHKGLAAWLDSICPIRVRLAANGQMLHAGEVLVAPGDAHLGVERQGRVLLTLEPPINGQRPSVTHLFTSAANAFGPRDMAVILTGMGDDGAVGLRQVKRAGGFVVAQDEATCVVYGMPAIAVAMGVVDKILPLNEIAGAIDAAWRPDREPALMGRSQRV